MNSVSLYIRAHCFNSTTAALEQMINSPSEKNYNFAKKMVDAKITSLTTSLAKKNVNTPEKTDRLEKYQECQNFITAIKSVRGKDDITYPKGTIGCIDGKVIYLKKPEELVLKNKFLPKIELAYRDLRKCNFDNANNTRCINGESEADNFNTLKKTINDFSFSNLDGVDLRGVSVLCRAEFKYASMVKTIVPIKTELPYEFDFSGANLRDAMIELIFPDRARVADFKKFFTRLPCDTSLFKVLDTISDNYADVKINLLHQMIDFVNRTPLDLRRINDINESFINLIYSRDFYLKDEKILKFAQRCMGNIVFRSDKAPLTRKLTPTSIQRIMNSEFIRKPEFMLEHNGFFNQLIGLFIHHPSPDMQKLARGLYNDYLKIPEIAPYKAFLDLAPDAQTSPDQINNTSPDWSDKSHQTYILISNHKEMKEGSNKAVTVLKDKAMIISHENLFKMLNPGNKSKNIQWNNFYIYEKKECETSNNIDLSKIFKEDFPVFDIIYSDTARQLTILNLLSTLSLGDYKDVFAAALSGRKMEESEKLVNEHHQKKLTDIFSAAFEFNPQQKGEIRITAEHLEKIINEFNLGDKSDAIKFQTFFTLALIIDKLSASSVLGTEHNSPQALRIYAMALLNEASQILLQKAPDANKPGQVLPAIDVEEFKEKYSKWQNKLLGINGEFSCAEMIFESMRDYAVDNFEETFLKICPLGWR